MLILDQLEGWLSYPGLGSTIKDAISKNKISPLNESLKIGEQNWAAGLIKKIEKLIYVCEEIKKNEEKFEKGCTDRFKHINNTLQTYKNLKKMGKKIHSTFIKLLEKDEEGNLLEVLNELMDLFTPARWAYEEISIKHEYSNRRHKLHFEIAETKAAQGKKARADFRLNTAELNIFALSLFTLCAVRNKNPLSLLIFDDPLQNMDEITVTTLARGLNKLIKLFPDNWQIIMLFHGLEDLERFCQEIPASVYFLPWLSPLTGKEDIKIEPDPLKSQVFTGTQDLNEIVEIRA